VGVLSEDIEDQSGAVQQLDIVAQYLLEFSLMAWGELVVEQNDVGGQLVDPLSDLPGLPRSHERCGMRMDELLYLVADHDHARRVGQALKLR
jgi:hypothetical protein